MAEICSALLGYAFSRGYWIGAGEPGDVSWETCVPEETVRAEIRSALQESLVKLKVRRKEMIERIAELDRALLKLEKEVDDAPILSTE